MNPRYFKEIPGFSDYLIAKTGKIWSKKRKRYLKTTYLDNLKGYPRIDLYLNGKRCRFFVHRLVALVYKPRPEGKDQVNHDDFNIKNFHADNLTWMNQSENMLWNRKKGFNGKPLVKKYNHEKAKAAAGTPF
jgi:hypothetical protein